ncbi:MAG: STAS/SEC14 domain-containing protein [Ginsengibacter sp.]
MIEIIPGLSPETAAFKAVGKVTKDDYEKILMPEVGRISKTFDKINFFLLLDTNVGNYSMGAWIDDALVGLKHLFKWHRVAIVSDQKMVKTITDIFGHLVPGEYKGFVKEETEAAKKWVTGK